jgi:hypothetical protein
MLKAAYVPNTQYNINIYNNVLAMTGSIIGAYTLTVPVGQYTTTDLLTYINAQVQLASATFLLSQSTVNQRLTWAAPGEVFTITPGAPNTISKALGVLEPFTFGGGSPIENPFLPDLGGVKHVYIGSRALSNTSCCVVTNPSQQQQNIMADIPITVPWGTTQVENTNNSNSLDYMDYHSYKNISAMDIELTDEDRNPLRLNGADYVLMFRVWG